MPLIVEHFLQPVTVVVEKLWLWKPWLRIINSRDSSCDVVETLRTPMQLIVETSMMTFKPSSRHWGGGLFLNKGLSTPDNDGILSLMLF